MIGTKLQYSKEIRKHSEVKRGFRLKLNREIRQKESFTMLTKFGYTVMIVVVKVASRGLWDSRRIVRSVLTKWSLRCYEMAVGKLAQ